ncbi:MAG: hypothetical protein Kow0013_29360 [Pararhodobacter sp.]
MKLSPLANVAFCNITHKALNEKEKINQKLRETLKGPGAGTPGSDAGEVPALMALTPARRGPL